MFNDLTRPISHGNALNFDDLQKTGDYTTRKEIDEMRELQQVITTVPDVAKRCRFYRVEFLNGASTGRGEKCRQIDGNGAKVTCAAVVAK